MGTVWLLKTISIPFSGPCVQPGTKFKVLNAYFVLLENKQQDDSFHLFTIIKTNKLKSTQQCLIIEYNILLRRDKVYQTTQSILTLTVLKQ